MNCSIIFAAFCFADLELILATSTDPDELLYVWDQWRAASGTKVRTLFQDYVRLSNEAALANGKSKNFSILNICKPSFPHLPLFYWMKLTFKHSVSTIYRSLLELLNLYKK